MLQSKLFLKTLREDPKDEKSTNAKLLMRAGFIDKLISGVYSYLPLGLMVIRKIENIIREEMNDSLSAQEVLMPALHPIENYRKTGRDNIDILFHTKMNKEKELVLGQSHEEVIVPLAKNLISSYKDLPLYVYQIQNKFRKEARAKSGILRGREFIMKDLYSFHKNEDDLNVYYEKARKSYENIFKKIGIGDKTYFTFADGGTFSKYSHEFQTVTDAGEDIIYICEKCEIAINKEITKEYPNCPQCGNSNLKEKKSIEVGNIFKLKTRYSEPFNCSFRDPEGKMKFVNMGCYGIGVSRLLGTIVEIYHDEKGIIWPEKISPFDFHLIQIGNDPEVKKKSIEIYKYIKDQGKKVLYDDREKSTAGEKFADADLIGITNRFVISEKTLKENSFEMKKRNEEKTDLINIKKISQIIC